MPDDKKQIEEMAKDLYHTRLTANDLCGGQDCEKCPKQDWHYCDEGFQSDELQKLGYRKIPEGAVVLTREELNDLEYNAYTRGVNSLNTLYEKQLEKARKETAREIIKILIPPCEICDEDWHKGCLCLRATIAEKIATEYGVEEEK